jgi:hypothetical protein
MRLRREKLLGGFNRYRLVITLGLAVLLPAAALDSPGLWRVSCHIRKKYEQEDLRQG